MNALIGSKEIKEMASMSKGITKNNKSIIQGIILPEKWNDTGKIIGIAIHTDDETTYLVENNRKGQELLKIIRQKVRAKGKIRERIDGKKVLIIQDYNTVDDAEASLAI